MATSKTVKKCEKPHLPAQEAQLYAVMQVWAKTDKPMLLFYYVTHSRRLPDGTYNVESLTGETTHHVDLERNYCSPCKGYDTRQDCSPIRAMKLRSRIEFTLETPQTRRDYVPRGQVEL